jgi:ATP-dependent exoDNAse (exonuclease V) alpha subunit
MSVDCVVIDEAGQLSLGHGALAMRSLSPDGRIILAGDSEQLAPILAAQYPKLGTRLFGSILDRIMHLATYQDTNAPSAEVESVIPSEDTEDLSLSQSSAIVQLTENFRCVLAYEQSDVIESRLFAPN